MNTKALRRIGDFLVLLALSLYLVSGRDSAPFHGDEASHIFTSRDYYYVVHEHDFSKLYFAENWLAPTPQEQWQRLMTGTIHKWGIGLALDLAGFTVTDLNQDWSWDYDVNINSMLGNMPDLPVLHAARTSSLVFTILSYIFVWAIALHVIRNRPGVWAAVALYATTPSVLLDGRRVMMEGAMLFASTLMILVTLYAIRQIERSSSQRRALLVYIVVGLAGGLALASKLNSLFTVVAAFMALALAKPYEARHRIWQEHWHWQCIGLGSVVTLLTLVALTPSWWPDPLGVPSEVLDRRINLIDDQVKEHGGYANWGERAEGMMKAAFYGGPQYFEAPQWAPELTTQQQIKQYEDDHLAGRMGGVIWGIVLGALFVAGNLALLRVARRNSLALLVLLCLWINIAGLLITNPLPWIRYYLVLQAPLALCSGAGAGAALQTIPYFRKTPSSPPSPSVR